jgi:hypothetical protein
MYHLTSITPRIWLAVLLALSLFVMGAQSVFAQAGISISPALIEETLDPGFTKDYSIELRNLEDTEQTYFLSTRNISDVRPGGVPVFARENQEPTGMELADWVALSTTEVTLGPDESVAIPFTLQVPENASPGSHFGGVFISREAPEIQNSGAAVGYQVANIISIRVSGDVNESASIRQFSTDKFLYGTQNVTFDVRIENTGNVSIQPSGPVIITNMLGQEVDKFIFNEELARVLPKFPNPVDPSMNGIREFQFNWQGEGVGFGRYEVLLSAVYGDTGAKQTMSSTASFWVLPMNIIGPALGVLAVLLLIVFVVVRLYINRTVARLSGGRTRVIRTRRQQGPSPLLLLTVVMLVDIALFLIVLLALFA